MNSRAIDSSITAEKLPILASEASEVYTIAFISFVSPFFKVVMSYEPKVPTIIVFANDYLYSM